MEADRVVPVLLDPVREDMDLVVARESFGQLDRVPALSACPMVVVNDKRNFHDDGLASVATSE